MSCNEVVDNYSIYDEIATGAYGTVCKAKLKLGPEIIVAIKKQYLLVNKKNARPDYFDRTVLIESSLLHMFNCPNIIKPLNYIMKNNIFYTAMTYYRSTLVQFMKSKPPLKVKNNIMFKLLYACYYMEQNRTIHQDLKETNILMDGQEPLLIDLGLARYITDPQQPGDDFIQTLDYRSPEILFENTTYDNRIDVWSLGIIFYTLITGDNLIDPAYTDNEKKLREYMIALWKPSKQDLAEVNVNNIKVRNIVVPGIYSAHITENIEDQNLAQLIISMLQFNPRKRATLLQCITNPYFKSFTLPHITKVHPPSPYPTFIDIPSDIRIMLIHIMLKLILANGNTFISSFVMAISILDRILSKLRYDPSNLQLLFIYAAIASMLGMQLTVNTPVSIEKHTTTANVNLAAFVDTYVDVIEMLDKQPLSSTALADTKDRRSYITALIYGYAIVLPLSDQVKLENYKTNDKYTLRIISDLTNHGMI